MTSDQGIDISGKTFSSDGDISNNLGNSDYWIIKINNNGNLLWEKTYGGSNEDDSTNILKMSDSEFVIVGAIESSDGNISYNYGYYDCWLIKIAKNKF